MADNGSPDTPSVDPSVKAPSVETPVAEKGYGDVQHDFDKGIKAWLQVLGAFFLWFNSWGIINTWGSFQAYYEQDMLSQESASTIAWIGSIEAFCLMFVGAISGPLFDAGYFYVLVPFGSFMIVFGYMMTSLASEYYQIMLAQGICIGIGTGCLFVPAVSLMPQYFQKRRAVANGIAATGSSLGGVIYPIMFYRLEKEVGFPWATRALGFVAMGTCAVSMAVMRVRFKPKEKRALLQLSAFKEAQFSLLCLASFIGFMGFLNFVSYVQPWALDKGVVDPGLSFYLVAIFNAASTFGRLAPNYAADYWGPLNLFVPAAAITGVLGFSWMAVGSQSGAIALVVIFGFCSGGFVSLPPVIMAVITKDLRTFGTRFGMLFGVVSFGMLIGTPIGGAIVGDTGSYVGLQAFCGACLMTSSILTLVIRLLRSGPVFIFKT